MTVGMLSEVYTGLWDMVERLVPIDKTKLASTCN